MLCYGKNALGTISVMTAAATGTEATSAVRDPVTFWLEPTSPTVTVTSVVTVWASFTIRDAMRTKYTSEV